MPVADLILYTTGFYVVPYVQPVAEFSSQTTERLSALVFEEG